MSSGVAWGVSWMTWPGWSATGVAAGRGRSRLVATCRLIRERNHLIDLGDVARDGIRRDEVLVAKCGLHLLAIEMAVGAIALQRSDGSRMAARNVALGDLLEGQGEVAVCRDLSRRVATDVGAVGHAGIVASKRSDALRLST